METTDTNIKFMKAKNKVEKLKRFYVHLTVYMVINTVISVVKITNNMSDGETFDEVFFDFSTYIIWLAWGIGLALHAFSVFGIQFILGDDWEKRKIDELMNKELNNTKD